MKINFLNFIMTIAITGFLSSNIALAEDKPTSTQEHGLHHPNAPSTSKETKPSNENSGLMGKTDMAHKGCHN
jgi:hypothetical protein